MAENGKNTVLCFSSFVISYFQKQLFLCDFPQFITILDLILSFYILNPGDIRHIIQ